MDGSKVKQKVNIYVVLRLSLFHLECPLIFAADELVQFCKEDNEKNPGDDGKHRPDKLSSWSDEKTTVNKKLS